MIVLTEFMLNDSDFHLVVMDFDIKVIDIENSISYPVAQFI